MSNQIDAPTEEEVEAAAKALAKPLAGRIVPWLRLHEADQTVFRDAARAALCAAAEARRSS